MALSAFVATGTRFNDRTVVESPVPIDIVTSAELAKGGHTEVSRMLQALVPSFNFPRPSLTDGTDHIRPATLRGLAPDQTLVLVNGKRRHTSALVNVNGSVGRGSVSVDFNAFPASAIERVEILRDGASAQYGSDAIAGVVNVILKREHGWGFDATYGATEAGDGRELSVSGFGGVALGDKGYLFATVYWRERSPINRIESDTRQQYFGSAVAGALVAPSANYGSGVGLSSPSGTLDPRESTINRWNHHFGDARANERGFFINGDFPVGSFIGYFFGGATNRHGEAAAIWRRPADDRTVRALWPDGFLPVIQSSIWDVSGAGGLRGRIGGGWDLDASTTLGANALAYTTAESNNVTLGAASPRSFYAGTLAFRQSTINLDLQNRFSLGFAVPLKVALGGEFRHESYRIRPGTLDSYRDGGVRVLDGPNAGAAGAQGAQGFAGFRPGDAGRYARDAHAFYSDVEQALTARWLMSAAIRYEGYSDFGEETTAKLATRLVLAEPFALRGSVSTGFRAPHLAQRWFSSTATTFIGGAPFENKTFPVSDPIARALGAQPLRPETSTNVSVGATWQQRAGFAASVDVYQIEIDDRVVLSSNFVGAPGTPFINYLNAQGLFGTTGGRYFTNAVDTRTRGVDLNLRYVGKFSETARLTLTAGGNFNRTEVVRFKPTPPQLAAVGVATPLFDLTERIRMERGQPRDVLNFAAGYERGAWSLLARTIRYGGTEMVAFSAATPAQQAVLLPSRDAYVLPTAPASANSQIVQRFGSTWVTDLDVACRVSRHLTISGGVNNVFGALPDENLRSTIASGAAFNGSDNFGIFPYSSISPFGFSGASYYGKVSWRF